MRLWLVNPKIMCNKHLLGEHVECHMFLGTITKGISIDGYVRNSLIDTTKLKSRHDQLVDEMTERGMNHKTPLDYVDKIKRGKINIIDNEHELISRCKHCRERYENIKNNINLINQKRELDIQLGMENGRI